MLATPEGHKLQAEVDRISDCYDHTNWGLEMFRPSASLCDGMVNMQWCNLNEGTTNDQILGAAKKLNALMDQGSSTGGISRWWPGSGIPSRLDAD